jgi:hypothetical protein
LFGWLAEAQQLAEGGGQIGLAGLPALAEYASQ